MKNAELRVRQLQQIPVFALRQAVHKMIVDERNETLVVDRLSTILKRKPKNYKRDLQRLNREQLTDLYNLCPEITNDQITDLFEEYRYGSNPSFYIYLFYPRTLARFDLEKFKDSFEHALRQVNESIQEVLPRIRRLSLNDLSRLPECQQIVEGNYKFEARLDYIDETQSAVSTYQTLYGFFWLDTGRGYVIIHAHGSDALDGIRYAIAKSTETHLDRLLIAKQLKNMLPFLPKDSLRSGQLHDPDPGPKRFRLVTITDDDPYAKGYQDWEDDYPELRTLRYRKTINSEKETTLTVRCDQGILSLAGRLKASQFRSWCLDTLDQLMRVVKKSRPGLPRHFNIKRLKTSHAMAPFTPVQTRHMTRVVSTLATLKHSPHLGYMELGFSPLNVGAELGQYLRAKIPLECDESGCQEEGYMECPICSQNLFTLSRQGKNWLITCQEHRVNPWGCNFPVRGECVKGHPFTLDQEDLEDRIELHPVHDLLDIIALLMKDVSPQCNFEPKRESFIVRGKNLIYFPNKNFVRQSSTVYISVNQRFGRVTNSNVYAVHTNTIGDVTQLGGTIKGKRLRTSQLDALTQGKIPAIRHILTHPNRSSKERLERRPTMDPIQGLIANIMAVLMPFVTRSAEQFAKDASETAFNKARALFDTIKEHLAGDKDATDTLTHFEKEPEPYKSVIEHILRKRLAQDNTLASELSRLVEGMAPELRVIQKMKVADGVTGIHASEMTAGKAEVVQESNHAKNVTGIDIGSIGGGTKTP